MEKQRAKGRKKGTPKTGGRAAGTPNKTTASVKEALTTAFDGLGGTLALTNWGKANPTQFYALWAKLLPQEVSAKVDQSVSVEVVGSGFDGLHALMIKGLQEIEKNKTLPKR